MKPRLRSELSLLAILLVSYSLPGDSSDPQRIELAEFSESYVTVSIELEGEGQAALVATFTPTKADAHLYSIDYPRRRLTVWVDQP